MGGATERDKRLPVKEEKESEEDRYLVETYELFMLAFSWLLFFCWQLLLLFPQHPEGRGNTPPSSLLL